MLPLICPLVGNAKCDSSVERHDFELDVTKLVKPGEANTIAIRVMSDHDFSQICVTKARRIIGSLNEAHLYEQFVHHAAS